MRYNESLNVLEDMVGPLEKLAAIDESEASIEGLLKNVIFQMSVVEC